MERSGFVSLACSQFSYIVLYSVYFEAYVKFNGVHCYFIHLLYMQGYILIKNKTINL